MHGWHTPKKLLNHKHNWILKYLNALFICVWVQGEIIRESTNNKKMTKLNKENK